MKILLWSQFLSIDQIPRSLSCYKSTLKNSYFHEPTHICLDHENVMRDNKMLCWKIGSLCQSSPNLVGHYSNLEIKALVSEVQQRRRRWGRKHTSVPIGLPIICGLHSRAGRVTTFRLLQGSTPASSSTSRHPLGFVVIVIVFFFFF